MRKIIIVILIIFAAALSVQFAIAQQNLAQKLSGRILLQVQSHGEAWYVNPTNYKKYYLGRPQDAFALMCNLGIGITNENLNKIPVGIINDNDQDDDQDGLSNSLETALGTDPQKADTDNDGYNDKLEIEHNYNPLGNGKLSIDNNFTNQHLGKIFLQIERAGQAWYLNPADKKRYYLGKPTDAFMIMKNLSLGITNKNINKITRGYFTTAQTSSMQPSPTCASCQAKNPDAVFAAAASAIRLGDKTAALSCFTPRMQKAIEYTMDFLDNEGKFILGNIMSGAKLSNSTDNERIYATEVYFPLGGYKVPISFRVQKQKDGTWLLTNLGMGY